MSDADDIEHLKKRIADLEAENYVLRGDVASLGPENARLSNAYKTAVVEIARLNDLLLPKGRGRPTKKGRTGTYEEYLFRETMEIVAVSMRDGGRRMSEKKAAIEADKRIRATANNLQNDGMPGAFAGLSANYPADEKSIYNAFRRAKRESGFARITRTNK